MHTRVLFPAIVDPLPANLLFGFSAQRSGPPSPVFISSLTRGFSVSSQPQLFVCLGLRSAFLLGFLYASAKSALLQVPGVGGHFCRKAGLHLGPTRLVGVSLATVWRFEFALFWASCACQCVSRLAVPCVFLKTHCCILDCTRSLLPSHLFPRMGFFRALPGFS